MKTPEEMAEEYRENHDECEFARDAFLAGYKAGHEQALDTISKMDNATDRMLQRATCFPAAQPQWISVKDRLPHDVGCSGPYLVWAQEQPDLLPIQSGMGLCHFDTRETPKWSSNLGHHITHWMPLPTPPEGHE